MNNPKCAREAICQISYSVTNVSVLVIVGISQVIVLGFNKSITAQIIPDNTLGAASSVVTPDNINGLESDRISGGAVRGSNLFHSFQEFNIDAGKGAYFDNPAAIQNIFSRVTGSNPSNILGTLGVLGNANLFFMNPNGIIFGNNARLDIRGSFLATTADSILFPDGNKFSALNPEAATLLTVNVEQPIGLQFEGREGIITNQGILEVNSGKNLALVGGDLTIDGGGLIAPGGRVDLVGLTKAGIIGFNSGDILSFPNGIARGNISLTNQASIDVAEVTGGNINLIGRDLNIDNSEILAGIGEGLAVPNAQAGDINFNATGDIKVNRSFIFNDVNENSIGNAGQIILKANTADINNSLITSEILGEGKSGNIVIDTTDSITVNTSWILNNLGSGGVGEGGDVVIMADSLSLDNNSRLSASTFGVGNAGKVLLNVKDSLSLSNITTIFNIVENGAIGNSGGIFIKAGSFSLTEGAELQASTNGIGNGGDVIIEVRDAISFDGVGNDGFASGIFSPVKPKGFGRGGDVTLTAGSLSITDGARIQTKSEGQGATGNVKIEVRDLIFFDGAEKNPNPAFEHITGIFTTVQTSTFQQGGDIEINAGSLSIINGAELTANTFGLGNSGNIVIEARDSISLDGINNRGSRSGIFSAVGRDSSGNIGKGQGGDIEIVAKSLALNNGAGVASATLGQGDAGKITIITQETVSLDGLGSNKVPSFITTSVEPEAIGDANDIDITTKLLTVTNGNQINASSLGEGQAGSITITANTLEAIKGGQLLTNTSSNFSAGDIILRLEDHLFLSGSDSGLFAQTAGGGKAGNIIINTPTLTIDQDASISAFTEASGDSGTIIINAPQSVLLTDGSSLTVETTAAGKPGNIFITTPNLTIGKDSQLSATATATSTNTEGGGSITINTSNLDLTGKLGIFAETRSEAPAGTLSIQPYTEQTELNIKFTDAAFISTLTEASGVGGDINLTAPETINISGEGKITAETSGSGNAGNINIETKDLNISNQTEISASTSGTGEAGDINITAAKFNFTEAANLFTNTLSSASAGDIELNITDSINLSNSTIRAGTTLGSTGDGGSIIIDPATMTIQDGAEIATDSRGSGEGGDIEIQAGLLTLDNSKITAETASNQGGDITLTLTDKLRLRNKSQITATAGTAEAGGDGGNININAPFIITFPNENSDITANAFAGNGGNITINTQGIFGIEFRNQQTALSDITASSRFGQQGIVNINTSAVDPTRSLDNLPQESTETEVAQSCQENNSTITLEFFDIGRGGLPPTPDDLLSSEMIIAEWIPLNLQTEIELSLGLTEKEISKINMFNAFSCQ